MSDEQSPMQRFEDLAKRLFSKTKQEIREVEESVEEMAEEIVHPEEPTAD